MGSALVKKRSLMILRICLLLTALVFSGCFSPANPQHEYELAYKRQHLTSLGWYRDVNGNGVEDSVVWDRKNNQILVWFETTREGALKRAADETFPGEFKHVRLVRRNPGHPASYSVFGELADGSTKQFP